MSSIRLSFSSLPFAAWALGLSVLAGCPQEPNSVVCPGTGIICPENTYCGAVQPVCLTTSCGNGILDLNEQCDDGNIEAGDSCSPICKREECGNNVLDPNEVCDDGNEENGDGCNSTCTSKEICGNKIVDVGEACDDGNAMNADGCSGTPVTVGGEMSPSACKSTEVCGNGVKDLQVGEVCDDGNTISGDGCNSDCRSGEGCGNGIVDPGEQCDDGNANNNDDCLNACKTAKCGDGVIDNTGTHGETCDAGTTGSPVETATCNIDCTVRACGDGKVNQTAGEQCDNGVGNNGDTRNCTAPAPTATPPRPGCQLNVCGDGLVDAEDPRKEQCDDGNTNNLDDCSNSCQSANCGNSVVNIGEDCDDGNTVDTDACVSCHTAVCGDLVIRAGVEECDGGQNVTTDNCSNNCRIERCGNSIIDPGEQCDDGNMSNTDGCTTGTCQLAVCGDHFVRAGVEQCDDGNTINGDGCSSTCRNEGCGNGTTDPGEQCDDGNMVSGDGCSYPGCTFEACGDGIVNNGEACDGNGAGVGGETMNCNADCTVASCGDGKTNATRGEQCDAGPGLNANDRDCTATCKINICTDGHIDTKGPNHFEFCDDGNQVNTDGCNNSCTLASCGNGLLDPGEQCDDNNAVNTDACNGCQNARCGDGVLWAGVEECDGSANCSSTCRLQVCGNGIIDPGEQCDDSNLVNGDGCSGTGHPLLTACKFEYCGDKLKGASEPCDYTDSTFGPSGNGSCNRDCTTAVCGDGKLSPFAPSLEECDFGAGNGGTSGCTAPVGGVGGCKLEHCGDGNADAGEQCDNGASNSSSGPCLPYCQKAVCGDGLVQSASSTPTVPGGAETCDLGAQNGATKCAYGLTSCVTCSATTCQPVTLNTAGATHYCGDGTLDNTGGDPEACDNGTVGTAMFPANGLTACPYNTSCTTCKTDCTGPTMPTPAQCGDGTVNGPVEKCDLGAGNNTAQRPATCAYGTTCTACPAGCATTPTTISGGYCGDGTTQSPETCDAGNMNTTNLNCPYASTQVASLALCTQCTTGCTSVPSGMRIPHYCGDGQCDTAGGNEAPGTCVADCGSGQYSVTVVKTGGGVGDISGGITCTGAACTQASTNVNAGGSITLTATATAGSTFTGWGGDCSTAVGASCTLTVNAAKTATANFVKIQQNVTVTEAGTGQTQGTLTVMPGGGTSCGANCTKYEDGSVLVITATPGMNNAVTWSGCDSTVGNVCVVTVNGTENVQATFTLAKFTVTVTVSTAAGTVTSSPAGITCTMATSPCAAMFDAFTNLTLTPSGGTLTAWGGDCTGTGACTYPSLTAPGTVSAAFTP